MFFLINKPVGMTSFDVIRRLRKNLGIKKMGHIGTLDPLASGLLLVATEQSTKLFPFLEGKEKTYRFSVRIDGTTKSLDCAEEIVHIPTDTIEIPEWSLFEKKLLSLREQTPPLHSALHIGWRRAYSYARKGENITLPSRNIRISHAEFLGKNWFELSFRVTISNGGYIRSLAPTIAAWCKSSGGYISTLERETIHLGMSSLTLQMSHTLEQSTPETCLPLETLFPAWTFIQSNNTELERDIKNGKKITLPEKRESSIGTYFFISFPDNYHSLIQKTQEGYTIIKNNL